MGYLTSARKFGYVVALVLLVLCAGGQRAESADAPQVLLSPDEQQWLAKHPEIRIGLRETPPLAMRNARDGTFSGLSIDYIKLLERRLGVRFKLVYYPTWRELIEKAEQRKVDVLVTAVWTPQRAQWLTYTLPYIILTNKIIARRGAYDSAASLEDMRGKRVGVLDGSALHDYLKRYEGLLTVVPIRNESLALADVSFGAIDAAVMDVARASYYTQKENITNLVAIGAVDYNYEYGFASRKDWPLLGSILGKGLTAVTPKERDSIFRQWVIPFSSGTSILKNRSFWLAMAGTGIGVFTVMLLLWNKALRRRVKQSTAELSILNEELRNMYEQAKMRSLRDPLTALWNHEEILRIVGEELERAKREGGSVAVMMINLDYFKKVNDTYGHLAGDAVLRTTAKKLRSALRSYDSLGRYGGEEFLLLLSRCDLTAARDNAERIRKIIEASAIETPAGKIAVTISIGLAVSRPGEELATRVLVHAADMALYRAKTNGRNRVEYSTDDERNAANASQG